MFDDWMLAENLNVFIVQLNKILKTKQNIFLLVPRTRAFLHLSMYEETLYILSFNDFIVSFFVTRTQWSTPEELVRWSPAPDLRNVPLRESGLSAQTMTGYTAYFINHFITLSCFLEKHKLTSAKVLACLLSQISCILFIFPFLQQGYKCPSGCRIQGLMDKYDHSLLKKIEKIRSLLNQNKAKHRSADQVSKQTYDYLKDKLTTDAG